MAVRAVTPGIIGVPLNPLSPFEAGPQPVPVELAPTEREALLEVVGRSEKRLAEALHASDVAVTGDINEETIHALRLLAIDNLVDIVQLREALDERNNHVGSMSAELESWRVRALEEAAARKVEFEEFTRHERELVSVLHRQITENYRLSDELNAQRRPWWRRRGAA